MTRVEDRQGMIVDRRVTYTLEVNGRFVLVENVPARVNLDTGEQLFTPQTVEQLQRLIRGGEEPVRMVETPVYQFIDAGMGDTQERGTGKGGQGKGGHGRIYGKKGTSLKKGDMAE